MRQRFVFVALAAVIAGCTTGNPAHDHDGSIPPGPDVGPPPTDSGSSDVPDARPHIDAGPRLDDVLIYAHSRDILYTFSAYTNTVTEIGRFRTADGKNVPPVLDLAVDSEGVVLISTDDWDDTPPMLYEVDPDDAVATPIGELRLNTSRERLFALSFLAPDESPDGTEMLIGATNEGAYFEVDRHDASTRHLGNYPEGWASSGDIVSVEGLGTFATLRQTGRDAYPGDILARIIFPRGEERPAVIPIGPIRSQTEDFRSIYGLGYWGRNLYGFSSSGQLIQIDRTTAAGSLVTTQTGASQFWGAGVTIMVPVIF